jgi:hypothetical protein
MGLADLFRPKWRHSNPEVRIEAVRQLGEDQTTVLATVAERDPDARVRRVALKRIDDVALLYRVAEHDPDPALREAAADRADERVLASANGDDERAALAALEKLKSPRQMAQVAQKAAHASVRERAVAAVARTGDDKALAEVARRAHEATIRKLAVEKLNDATALREVALNDTSKDVALAAVSRLSDRQSLEKVAHKAQSKAVRAAAREKLPPPEKKLDSPEAQKRARLLELCHAVETADDPAGVEAARAAFAKEGADDEMRRRFDRACERFYARRAATAKSVAKIAVKQAAEIEKLAPVEPHAPEAEAKPEAERPIVVEKVLAVDEEAERKKAERAAERARREAEKAEARAQKEAEERANLERLTQLATELEAVTVDDVKRGGEALKRAQEAFDALGPVPRDGLPVKERWQNARDKLKARVAELREAEDWKRWANAPKLETLCQRAESLLELTDLKQASQELKALQAAWKQAGPATKDKQQQLWERFKAATDQVHERTRAYFATLDEQRGVSLAKKEELIARVEALAESSDWKETAELIKALQEEWKAVGPVPKEKMDDTWRRFRGACDKFFERRKAHFEAGDAERAVNLDKQLALCAAVEKLVDASDFKRAGDEIKRLQAEWKTIGPVPRDKSEETWKRFRGACDKFFERRQQYFAQLDEERGGNLKAKVEALAGAPDVDEAIAIVKQLNVEWKALGPAPKDKADAVWGRFRTACDKIFERARKPEPVEAPATGYEAPKLGDKLGELIKK